MGTPTAEEFIAAYSGVVTRNRAKFKKLHIVLTRFQREGIDCILLKGADLIARLYGTMGLRPMADVDLLVRAHDLPAIDRLLTDLDYRPQIDENPAYADPEDGLLLDLITTVWYVEDQEVIWQRAVRLELEGVAVKGMGTEDLLMYLTAYAVLHQGTLSATFHQDIALLVEKESIDWGFVAEEARRRGLAIALYHGLSSVRSRRDHVPIPTSLLERLAPFTLPERCLYGLLRKLVTEQPIVGVGHLLLLLTQPRGKKWRWLGRTLFPDQAYLKYRYGGRWESHPVWIRIARPLYMIWRALGLGARVAVALLRSPRPS